jgi:pimeloyl-ACP methyl ester carboxylesterase
VVADLRRAAGETDPVKAAFRQPGCLEAALGYYRQLFVPKRRVVTVPTVSFAGDVDILDAAAFELARPWFTGGYHVVAMPGGHFMHREHPERFVAELLRALA